MPQLPHPSPSPNSELITQACGEWRPAGLGWVGKMSGSGSMWEMQPDCVNAGGRRCAGRPAARSSPLRSILRRGQEGDAVSSPSVQHACQPGFWARLPLPSARLLENHLPRKSEGWTWHCLGADPRWSPGADGPLSAPFQCLLRATPLLSYHPCEPWSQLWLLSCGLCRPPERPHVLRPHRHVDLPVSPRSQVVPRLESNLPLCSCGLRLGSRPWISTKGLHLQGHPWCKVRINWELLSLETWLSRHCQVRTTWPQVLNKEIRGAEEEGEGHWLRSQQPRVLVLDAGPPPYNDLKFLCLLEPQLPCLTD